MQRHLVFSTRRARQGATTRGEMCGEHSLIGIGLDEVLPRQGVGLQAQRWQRDFGERRRLRYSICCPLITSIDPVAKLAARLRDGTIPHCRRDSRSCDAVIVPPKISWTDQHTSYSKRLRRTPCGLSDTCLVPSPVILRAWRASALRDAFTLEVQL